MTADGLITGQKFRFYFLPGIQVLMVQDMQDCNLRPTHSCKLMIMFCYV